MKSYLYFPHISFEISKKDFEKILAENDSFVKLAVSDPIVVKSMQPNTKSVIRRPAWASFSSENIDLSVFVKFAESFDMMRMEIDASSTLSEVKPKESDEESDKEKEKPENKPVKDKELYQKAFSNVKEYPVGQVAVKITPVDIFSKQTIESTRRCIVIAAQMIFWLDTLRDLYNTEDKIENLKKILPIMNQIEVPDTSQLALNKD